MNKDCAICYNCTECIKCNWCIKCIDCTKCSNCKDSDRLLGCENSYKCTYCVKASTIYGCERVYNGICCFLSKDVIDKDCVFIDKEIKDTNEHKAIYIWFDLVAKWILEKYPDFIRLQGYSFDISVKYQELYIYELVKSVFALLSELS